MKIDFIIPGDPAFGAKSYPAGVAYLAALMEARGHDCGIWDEIAGDDVRARIAERRPDAVCFTGTTVFINRSYAHADWTRRQLPGTRIFIGGPHASALPEEALGHADIVIRHEAEGNFADAVEGRLSNGIHEGVYEKELDSLPLPAYHRLNMEYYLGFKDRLVGHTVRAASIITSRGCPWKCTFCYNSFRETPVRFHSSGRVMEEIGFLQKHYGVQGIFFADDEFILKPKRLAEICDYLKKEGLVWECQAQVRSLLKHPEVAGLLRESGCVQLGVGFESGSGPILEELKQGASTLEMNEEVVALCKKAGLPLHGTFIIGNPGETEKDIRLTEAFIKRHAAGMRYVSVFKTTAFPGTRIFKQCVEKGILKPPFDWSRFDCGPEAPSTNEHMTNEEINRHVRRINLRQTIRNYSWWELLKRAWRYRKFLRNYLPF